MFVLTLGVRLIALGLGLFLYLKGPYSSPDAWANLTSLEGHGIFFWMRMGMGIGLPIILAYMIYETAKMGANQACTGLLYIVVIFIFMGEAVSRYLPLFKRGFFSNEQDRDNALSPLQR